MYARLSRRPFYAPPCAALGRLPLLAVLCALLLPAAPARAQAGPTTLQAIGVMKELTRADCIKARAAETDENATEESRGGAKAYAQVSCECMPGVLEKMEADVKEGRLPERMARDDFAARVEPPTMACAGTALRKLIPEMCAADKDIAQADRPALCGCIAESIANVDDATLGREVGSSAQARRRAREAGQPVPGKAKGRVELAMDACEARFRKPAAN